MKASTTPWPHTDVTRFCYEFSHKWRGEYEGLAMSPDSNASRSTYLSVQCVCGGEGKNHGWPSWHMARINPWSRPWAPAVWFMMTDGGSRDCSAPLAAAYWCRRCRNWNSLKVKSSIKKNPSSVLHSETIYYIYTVLVLFMTRPTHIDIARTIIWRHTSLNYHY